MGFDADMRKVTERLNKWADGAVIDLDDFQDVDRAVQKYADERERLFDELQNALKRDTDIQSPWDNLCDKGLQLTERLNDEIEDDVPNGFAGMGMADFYEGEKAAWQECKSGRIGLIAEAMFEIGKNDVEIYKQLEEDLKRAREDSKLVDEVSRATFGDMKDSVRNVIAEVAGVLAAAKAAGLDMIGKGLSSKARQTVSSFIKGSSAMREMAKKKRAAKDILIRNSDMVDKAKEQIGDGAVRDILKRCEELTKSWKEASRGDYNAQDWDSFGRECVEILKDKSEPVIEKAKMLFDNMQPMYIESLKTSFTTLLSDPATLEKFKDELDDETQKMFDELAKEDVVISLLRDSEPKRTAAAQMKEIVSEVTEALKELKDAIREIDEEMKS